MTFPTVAVVLLNWNNHEDTLNCVALIEQLDYPRDRIGIVVVDNRSAESSRNALLAESDRYTLIPLEENIGFAAGNNAGIRYALDHGFDFIWILNSDVDFEGGILQKMLEGFAGNPSAGIASPKIFFKDPPDRLWYAGGRKMPFSIGHVEGFGALDTGRYDQLRRVDFGVGCCMLIRSPVFQRIGLFDEKFFFYHEDVDFCYRAQAAGFSTWFQPACRLTHHVSASTRAQPALRCFHHASARVVFFKKYTQPIAYPLQFLVEIFRFARLALVSGFRGQWPCAGAYLRGLISGWKRAQ